MLRVTTVLVVLLWVALTLVTPLAAAVANPVGVYVLSLAGFSGLCLALVSPVRRRVKQLEERERIAEEEIERASERALARADEKAAEYIRACYRMEAQKNAWQRRYHRTTANHMAALHVYERALVKERHQKRALAMAHEELRKSYGLEPSPKIEQIAGEPPDLPPVGRALDEAKALREIYDAAERDLSAAELLPPAENTATSTTETRA